MVVRKPLEKTNISNIDIDALISKGAHVIEDNKREDSKKKSTHINLRIPKDMLKHIDEVMKKRVGISRIGWILEAIQEKLEGVNNVR